MQDAAALEPWRSPAAGEPLTFHEVQTSLVAPTSMEGQRLSDVWASSDGGDDATAWIVGAKVPTVPFVADELAFAVAVGPFVDVDTTVAGTMSWAADAAFAVPELTSNEMRPS